MLMRHHFLRHRLPKALRWQQDRPGHLWMRGWLWYAAIAAGAFLLGRKTA